MFKIIKSIKFSSNNHATQSIRKLLTPLSLSPPYLRRCCYSVDNNRSIARSVERWNVIECWRFCSINNMQRKILRPKPQPHRLLLQIHVWASVCVYVCALVRSFLKGHPSGWINWHKSMNWNFEWVSSYEIFGLELFERYETVYWEWQEYKWARWGLCNFK